MDCSFLFCCEGVVTTTVRSGDVVDGTHVRKHRDDRGRGRSRTPRKNVNGRFDDNSPGESPRRKPRGQDGSRDRGSTTLGNFTDHTEPIFQSGETPFMGFCWPSEPHSQEQDNDILSQPTGLPSMSSHRPPQRRPEIKLSPRSHWACRKKENYNKDLVFVGHKASLQKERWGNKEIHQTTGEICDARDDNEPTKIATYMNASNQWFADSSASTQRTRGSRMYNIGQQPICVNDDRKLTCAVSSAPKPSYSPSLVDLSTYSNKVHSTVEMTADEETRDESPRKGTSRFANENVATGDPSKCLSPKTKQRNELPNSASKFIRGKFRSISHLVYGRRIANQIHHNQDKK